MRTDTNTGIFKLGMLIGIGIIAFFSLINVINTATLKHIQDKQLEAIHDIRVIESEQRDTLNMQYDLMEYGLTQ